MDPELQKDSPYGPDGMLIDQVLDINPEESSVTVRMPTSDDLPLTRTQRAHPVRHPRHVSGGLMVHMTGMAAIVHAFHVLGLRHQDGWVGYGVRIHNARFVKLAPPGEPVIIKATAVKVRKLRGKVHVRYAYTFTQGPHVIYTSEQSALFYRPEDELPDPASV